MHELLSRAIAGAEPFAIVSRERGVDVLVGDVVTVDTLADIPLRLDTEGPDVLALVPYRQIQERGFVCHDDDARLHCLRVRERARVSIDDVLAVLTAADLELSGGRFFPEDDEYATAVSRVLREEIGTGAGANFVLRRDFRANLEAGLGAGLEIFRRLLLGESGSYWTFFVHTPSVTLVGATPERHVSFDGTSAVMNPISGTYRHPVEGPSGTGVLDFLGDAKESAELFMVVDEELKMMSRICAAGGRVIGPRLKQMGHLTHTEYELVGDSALDPREILRETMFAPTVTGSPIENAARVIERYEKSGRGYYSGVLALFETSDGVSTVDAPILIRTCEISPSGELKISAGATLVRNSVPEHEVAETRSKLGGVLAALGIEAPRPRRRRRAAGQLSRCGRGVATPQREAGVVLVGRATPAGVSRSPGENCDGRRLRGSVDGDAGAPTSAPRHGGVDSALGRLHRNRGGSTGLRSGSGRSAEQ